MSVAIRRSASILPRHAVRTRIEPTRTPWLACAALPDDLDVATLYAEALFLLLPRPRVFPVDDPTVSRVLAVLEAR